MPSSKAADAPAASPAVIASNVPQNEFAESHALEAMVKECGKTWRATHPGPKLEIQVALSRGAHGEASSVKTKGIDAGADALAACIEKAAQEKQPWSAAISLASVEIP